ncbi:VPS13p like protein involved in vacuolar sorting [Cryptosporidium felis]|nr:VPS13p like protein involved in vacuolar sorting [Cryptosporidium felis]
MSSCGSDKIHVCRSVFGGEDPEGGGESEECESIRGHGHILRIGEIYPAPCNGKERAGLRDVLFDSKVMSEIVIQMQRQSEYISPSSRMKKNSPKTPTSLGKAADRIPEFSYSRFRDMEVPSMIIVTDPSTPLPHYRWVYCSSRANLERLKNVICSLL